MRHLSYQAVFTPVNLLGLAWVYSGAFWLLILWLAISSGWVPGAGALGIRLGVAVGIGVGLCARERWAWAIALGLSILHLAAAIAVASSGVSALVGQGNWAASWEPLLWGLVRGQTERLVRQSTLVAGLAAINIWLLIRHREELDVPYRRSFTVLAKFGFVPAVCVFALDIFLAISLHQVFIG